jgi:hypothetical protein
MSIVRTQNSTAVTISARRRSSSCGAGLKGPYVFLGTDNVSQCFEQFWVRLVDVLHISVSFHVASEAQRHKVRHRIWPARCFRDEVVNLDTLLTLSVPAFDLTTTPLERSTISL